MKIAASDFDGTISFHEKGIPTENLDAIRAWQTAGHKFGLVTGRNLGLVRHGLEGYDLHPDFCVCLNGAVAFDGEGKLLFAELMGQHLLNRLLDSAVARGSRRIGILQPIDSYGYVRRPSSEDCMLGKLPIQAIGEAELRNIPNVAQVSFLSDSPEAGMQGVEEIHRGFRGQLSAVSNGKFIDVVVSGNDKGSGMERLLECMGWQGMKVFAIGDNLNDLPMLRKFCGFTVESGTMEVKAEAEKVYVSVAEMLRENL